MRIGRRFLSPAILFSLVVSATLLVNPARAQACSCAMVDPVDAIGLADVVFTGVAVGNEGTSDRPVWRFEVNGVVKGDVGPVELVGGDDWAVGCGTDFSQFREPVAVYTREEAGGLHAMGCMPAPTAAALGAMLASIEEPTGSGPPAALLAGTFGTGDLAVLDGQGRTIERADLGIGGGIIAHCPGTTRAAVVSSNQTSTVHIVDLSTMSVVEQRSIDAGFVSIAGDRVMCLEGGKRVVTAAGFGLDQGVVTVATSNTEGVGAEDTSQTFTDVSRALLHPDGTVMLLPSLVDKPIRILSSEDLRPVADGVVDLPAGASVINGEVSPDGSTVALLATLSGKPIRYDSGASHVVLMEVVDGVPVAGSEQSLELSEAGENIETKHGAAKWIHWLDEDTMAIEHETVSSKLMQFVDVDGTQVLEPVDVGWGWGAARLPDGLLRAYNGGLELIEVDGTRSDGEPAPLQGFVDRSLSLAPLVDGPDFTPESTEPAERFTITPVSGDGPLLDPDSDPDEEGEPDGAAPVDTDGESSILTDDSIPSSAIAVGVAALAALVAVVGTAVSRRRNS